MGQEWALRLPLLEFCPVLYSIAQQGTTVQWFILFLQNKNVLLDCKPRFQEKPTLTVKHVIIVWEFYYTCRKQEVKMITHYPWSYTDTVVVRSEFVSWFRFQIAFVSIRYLFVRKLYVKASPLKMAPVLFLIFIATRDKVSKKINSSFFVNALSGSI